MPCNAGSYEGLYENARKRNHKSLATYKAVGYLSLFLHHKITTEARQEHHFH